MSIVRCTGSCIVASDSQIAATHCNDVQALQPAAQCRSSRCCGIERRQSVSRVRQRASSVPRRCHPTNAAAIGSTHDAAHAAERPTASGLTQACACSIRPPRVRYSRALGSHAGSCRTAMPALTLASWLLVAAGAMTPASTGSIDAEGCDSLAGEPINSTIDFYVDISRCSTSAARPATPRAVSAA